MPVLAMAGAFVTACGEDDPVVPAADASPDGQSTDASRDTGSDSAPGSDSSVSDGGDGGAKDAAKEADADADVTLPPLCQTYANNATAGDAGAGEGTRPRYELIALRALHSGTPKNADNSCEVSELFVSAFDPPIQFECLGFQLAALAGCTNAGQPLNYDVAVDENGDPCVTDAGAGNIQLGFRDPPGTYTANDVDYVADLVRQAALATGMAAADAVRLKDLYLSQRSKVTGAAAADGGDAGYSQSVCP